MDQNERVQYYKLLVSKGTPLTAGQQSDFLQLQKERGAASGFTLPAGGAKHEEAKRKL